MEHHIKDKGYLREWIYNYGVEPVSQICHISTGSIQEEIASPVYKGFYNRKLVYFEFLIFRRMGIVKGPLLEWYISANKIN